MYRQRSAVADQLGTAELKLILNTDALKAGLKTAKQQIESELGGTIEKATARGTKGRNGGGQQGSRGREAELRAASQLLRLRNSINILEANGVNVSKFRARLLDLETAAADKKYRTVRLEGEALRQLISKDQNRLRVSNILARNAQKEAAEARKTAAENKKADAERKKADQELQREGRRIGKLNVSPVGGGVAFPGSPKAIAAEEAAEKRLTREREKAAKATDTAAKREARRLETEQRQRAQRRRDIISNVAIGAGFPLLFGQGAGAAAGGALGGGLGGALGGTAGFAGSIVGTALGQAFDTALQKAQTLAVGLQDPIKNFDALKEAALLSSAPLEKQVQSLIDAGRTAEAYAIIQADLAQTFGSAEGAKEYQKAVDNLNREWSIATTRLANFVAGPLADFLQKISGGAAVVTGGITQNQTAQQAAQRPLARADIAAGLTRTGSILTLLGLTGAASGIGAVPGLGAAALGTGLVAGGQALGAQDDKAQRDAIFSSIAALKERARARKLDLDIQKASNQEALASIRGNEVEAATLKKRTAELERRRALQTNQPLVDVQRIDADIVKADAERLKAQQSLDKSLFDEFQKRQQIERSITNATQLLGTQQGVQRDALQTVQQITASITEARQKEAAIGFQIDQARVGGREEQARVLVEQQRTAAAETRQKFFEGALALRDAGENIRKNLTESVQSLQNLRLQNLQFLSPSQQADTLRQLQADVEQAAALRGFTPTFRGSQQEQLAQKAAFVDFARQEQQLQRAIAQGNEALTTVNQALSTQFTDLNGQLAANAAATAALAEKEWVVSVNVVNQAGGSSTVNTLNGLS